MMGLDINKHKHSGDVCDNSNGKPIVWNGHLCEGADLTAPVARNFCFWTKCREHDVPANKARVGRFEDVHCSACLSTTASEQGEG